MGAALRRIRHGRVGSAPRLSVGSWERLHRPTPWHHSPRCRGRPADHEATSHDGWPGNGHCEMRSMTFAIKVEVSDLRAETFAFKAQKTMYGVWRQAHQHRRYDLRLRERERRRARSRRPRRRDLGRPDPKETWDRATNTAREHHHQTRGACEAAPGPERAQTRFPPGTTADPRPSSTSNSIVRLRTRSSASRMTQRHSSADSSEGGRPEATRTAHAQGRLVGLAARS